MVNDFYLIRSTKNPQKTYIGYTKNLKSRLAKHNSKGSVYTKSDGPWKLVAYIALDSEAKAIALEKYLKAGSGYAFAKKRLW